jgi:hypothetical protein
MSKTTSKLSSKDIQQEKASEVIDIEEEHIPSSQDLKVHHDGSIILVPQPSNDPNDPLN